MPFAVPTCAAKRETALRPRVAPKEAAADPVDRIIATLDTRQGHESRTADVMECVRHGRGAARKSSWAALPARGTTSPTMSSTRERAWRWEGIKGIGPFASAPKRWRAATGPPRTRTPSRDRSRETERRAIACARPRRGGKRRYCERRSAARTMISSRPMRGHRGSTAESRPMNGHRGRTAPGLFYGRRQRKTGRSREPARGETLRL